MTAFTFVEQLNKKHTMITLDNVLFIEPGPKQNQLRIHFRDQVGYMDTPTTMNEIYTSIFTAERVEAVMIARQEQEMSDASLEEEIQNEPIE